MRLALYQPDIPQNAGTILRLAACLGVGVDIIEPAGFPTTDRAFRRAGMDYLDHVEVVRHKSFDDFNSARGEARLILLTTKANTVYTNFDFKPDDILLLGRETAGVPQSVHEFANARIVIPMQSGLRSINIAVAAAMVIGEALRQTGGLAKV